MRRKDKQIEDRAGIEAFIRQNRVCRLAMVDRDKPYVVPMNFGYQYPWIYFHSASRGRKIDLLEKNPNVCFEFDRLFKIVEDKNPCEWGAKFCSVIGEGKAFLVTDAREKRKGLSIIMAQYSAGPDDHCFNFSDRALEKTALIKVKISWLTGKESC